MTECKVVEKISEEDLAQFTCPQRHHPHNPRIFPLLLLTDGCHFLRERAKCFWLFDAIGTHLFSNVNTVKVHQYCTYQRKGSSWELTLKDDLKAKLNRYCDIDRKLGSFWKLNVKGYKRAELTHYCYLDKEVEHWEVNYTDISDYTDIKTVRIWAFPIPLNEEIPCWLCMLPSEVLTVPFPELQFFFPF